MKNIILTSLVPFVLIWQTVNAIDPNFKIVNGTINIPEVVGSKDYKQIGRYKKLETERKCQFSQCAGSTNDNILIHDYCFRNQCHYDHYHCLSDHGIILHFCAEFKPCGLRTTDIAVYNLDDPDYIDIYTVPCEHGKFQPNEKHSCFSPCANDTSVGIIKSPTNTPQLAYCITEHGCNRHGKLIFELGSRHDDCSGEHHCSTLQDSLPDCSCDAKCPPDHERLPENGFECTPRSGHVSPVISDTTDPPVPSETEPETVDKDPPKEIPDIIPDSKPETNLKEQPNSFDDNSSSNGISVLTIILVVIGGLSVGSFMTAFVIIRHFKKKRQASPPKDYECLDQDDRRSDKTGNTTYTKNSFKGPVNVFIGPVTQSSSGVPINHPEASTESPDTGKDTGIDLNEEQRMEFLKAPDSQSNLTEDEVVPKVVY